MSSSPVTATPSTKLAQGQVLTETFTVTVTDTFCNSVSQDITITIHGTNDKPVWSWGAAVMTMVRCTSRKAAWAVMRTARWSMGRTTEAR